MRDRWRLGTRNPFTVYRVADGVHDVEHGGYFLGSFRREEDARRSVDAVNAQAVHDGDTCQSADSDLESAQGELNEARLWLARRGVDVKAHRSLTWALNEAERAGVVGRPATEPAGSAVGQRGAPTRNVLVEAFDDALFYNGPDGASVFRWVEGRFTPADEPMLAGLAERMADVALAALRDGGAGTGGEDELGAVRAVLDDLRVRTRDAPFSEVVREAIVGAREQTRVYRDAAEAQARVKAWAHGHGVHRSDRPLVEIVEEVRSQARLSGVTYGQEVARADGQDYTSPDGRRWVTVEVDPETGEPLDAERYRHEASVMSHAHRDVLARLSTALGVSLDPDDPDPVGRLVEAAGKATECGCSTLLDAVNKRFDAAQDDVEAVSAALARVGHRDRENGEALAERVARALRFERRLGAEEAAPTPEVVSGDEAAGLPDNTMLVPCRPDGLPALGHHVRIVQDGAVKMPIPAGHEWLRFLVYRAPAPAPAALTVGDELVGSADATARAKAGTLVQSPHRGQRGVLTGDFSDGPVRAVAWETGEHLDLDNLIAGCWPMRVLDVPEPSVRVGTGEGET